MITRVIDKINKKIKENETESLFMTAFYVMLLLFVTTLTFGFVGIIGFLIRITGECIYNYCVEEFKFTIWIAWVTVLLTMGPIVLWTIHCIKLI